MSLYKAIDLFAGIGGIRRGFELTNNVEIVLSAEIDKYACSTYEYLYGENPLNDVTSEEFKKKVEAIDYDILLGGFPCQAFSLAGKREGFKDSTRGTLFFDIAEILSRTRPKAFLLENVKGLLSHKKGETFNIILDTLINELNYKIIGVEEVNGKFIFNKDDLIKNTKNFGLPQNRERVYIIGFRKEDIPVGYKFDKTPNERNDLNLYESLHDLLDFNVDEKFYVAQGFLDTLKKHKSSHSSKGNGFGYEVVNRKDIKYPIANTLLATGGSGKERNLVYDYKEGIAGKEVAGKKTPLNNEYIRIMTPNEWAKLQGFANYAFKGRDGSDKFTFPKDVSATQQYKQLGNSVSIPVIESLANFIVSNLKEIYTYRSEIVENNKGENSMVKLNKGEWSEFYVFLKSLNDSKFDVCDSDLSVISGVSYPILKILKENNNKEEIEFCLEENSVLIKGSSNSLRINKEEFKIKAIELLEEIKNKTGVFEVESIKQLIEELNVKVKTGADSKSDLIAQVQDLKTRTEPILSYSIKSKLGSPATILNASSSTNIIYEIDGLDNNEIEEINKISTRSKLKDRYNKLLEKKVIFKDIKIENNIFEKNLRYIDGDMPKLVCNIINYSYKYDTKDIKEIVRLLNEYNPLEIDTENYKEFYEHKVAKFIKAIIFGMMPSKLWNGEDSVTGGIIVAKEDGVIVLLDKIYYEKTIDKYLIENTKLDTPSSSRYKMLEIKKDNNNQTYFTLNLQIRFK